MLSVLGLAMADASAAVTAKDDDWSGTVRTDSNVTAPRFVLNVLANDDLDGVSNPAPASVTLTATSSVPDVLIFDPATGAVSFAQGVNYKPGIAVGNYSFTYDLCDNAGSGGACSSATVNVVVQDPRTAGVLRPFVCDGELYQLFGPEGNFGALNVNTKALDVLPGKVGFQANAAGYRALDNLVYLTSGGGTAGKYLLVTGADGATYNLGDVGQTAPPPNLPPGAYAAGAFGGDGYLNVTTGGGGAAGAIYRINVDTVKVVDGYTVNFPAAVFDIAWVASESRFFAVANGNKQLYSYPGYPGTPGTIAIGASLPVPPLPASVQMGSAFAFANGSFYMAENINGGIFRIGTSAANVSTPPDVLFVGTGAGKNVANTDGFSCPNATLLPATDLSITKDNGVTEVVSGLTTTYTITVSNHGPATAVGATISDPAVAGLIKTAVQCGPTPGKCVGTALPTVSQLEAGFGLPILMDAETYQLLVTAKVD